MKNNLQRWIFCWSSVKLVVEIVVRKYGKKTFSFSLPLQRLLRFTVICSSEGFESTKIKNFYHNILEEKKIKILPGDVLIISSSSFGVNLSRADGEILSSDFRDRLWLFLCRFEWFRLWERWELRDDILNENNKIEWY